MRTTITLLALLASVATVASYCNNGPEECVADCMVQGGRHADKPHGMCVMVFGTGPLGLGWYSW